MPVQVAAHLLWWTEFEELQYTSDWWLYYVSVIWPWDQYWWHLLHHCDVKTILAFYQICYNYFYCHCVSVIIPKPRHTLHCVVSRWVVKTLYRHITTANNRILDPRVTSVDIRTNVEFRNSHPTRFGLLKVHASPMGISNGYSIMDG